MATSGNVGMGESSGALMTGIDSSQPDMTALRLLVALAMSYSRGGEELDTGGLELEEGFPPFFEKSNSRTAPSPSSSPGAASH